MTTRYLLYIKIIKQVAYGILFGILDILSKNSRNSILVFGNYSLHEPDSNFLLRKLAEETDYHIYVSCSRDSLDKSHKFADFNYNDVTFVKENTVAFMICLLQSKIVVIRSTKDLHAYRFFSKRNRIWFLIDHGIITKGYGRYIDNARTSRPKKILRWLIDKYFQSNINSQTIASEIERIYRSSATGLHPSNYKKFGYPRFGRVKELHSNYKSNLDQIYSKQFKGDFNLLYAPTHKDNIYQTNLFPIDGFSTGDLNSFLASNNMNLHIRMHPNESNHPALTELTKHSNIFLAGQSVSESPIELFPYIDVLITDYSSIYIDFLPFDKPIIFFEDRPECFKLIRGIPFPRHIFFPGPSIRSFDNFKSYLIRIKNKDNDETYSIERNYLRRLMLEVSGTEFVSRLKDEYEL